MRDFFHVVFKRKLQILLFFLITVGVISIVTFTTEPIYEATSQIETFYIMSDSGGVANSPIGPKQDKQISSNIEILTSLDLAKQVARDLGPEGIYKILTIESEDTIDGAQQIPQNEQNLQEKAAWQLRKDLTAERENNSSIIEVRYRHTDRYLAATVVNKVVTLFFDSYTNEAEKRNLSGTLAAERAAANRTRIQPASLPVKPIKPKVMVSLLLAVFAGIMGAFLLAFVREYLDDSLEKTEDIEDALELPVLAYIPDKDRITDEIIGTIDRTKVHESEEKAWLRNIRFSPNPKWILAICLIIIAGVVFAYQGLSVKRNGTVEPPHQITKNMFTAKINKKTSNQEKSSAEGKEAFEQTLEKPKAIESTSEIHPPLMAKQTGSFEISGTEKPENIRPTVELGHEGGKENAQRTTPEEVIKTKLVDEDADIQPKGTDQAAGLPERTEKTLEGPIPEKEGEGVFAETSKSPEENRVEEKPALPKGTAKEDDIALIQRANDFFIQVGAFGKINRAEITTKKLREKGFAPFILENDTKRNTKIYRVRVRFSAQEITPGQAVERLKKLGYKDCFRVQ